MTPSEYQKHYRKTRPNYHKNWMRSYRKTPEGGQKHRDREKARMSDKRYAFKRLCLSYGLTVEDFARLLHQQDFKCPGCTNVLDMSKKTHIDHCHLTKRVRGILCHWCNLAVGQAKNSPATLRRLAQYLEATVAVNS